MTCALGWNCQKVDVVGCCVHAVFEDLGLVDNIFLDCLTGGEMEVEVAGVAVNVATLVSDLTLSNVSMDLTSK